MLMTPLHCHLIAPGLRRRSLQGNLPKSYSYSYSLRKIHVNSLRRNCFSGKLKINAVDKLSFSRVLLKLSGEALQGDRGHGIDVESVQKIASFIERGIVEGVQIAVVVGGGNFWRGSDNVSGGLDRASSDYMGMLATCMNAMALQAELENLGVHTRVQSAIEMKEIAEPYIRRRAIRHLERGRVVIFGAGTGNPFFTTDTAAALRAAEVNAQILLKATKVDGIYTTDPRKDPSAIRYKRVTFCEAYENRLQVMDATAFTICEDNDIPIAVFQVSDLGTVLCGDVSVGSLVD